MNPKVVFALWSFRRELKYVLFVFFGFLMLPVIAVILLTNTGLDVVSDRLVDQNPQTHKIQLKDPTTGKVVKEITPNVVWPTKGTITLEFGESSLYQPFHTGIDIAGNLNDPVTPAMEGKVIYAGEIFWGYGKHIIIDNGDNITTVYAHLNKIYVYKGQEVTIKNIIGTQGQTGWATGVHLHFQVNVYGVPVNPRVFLGDSNNKPTN